ncbi:hypothetical protein ACYSNU_05060 [Enterococcus sp. LJL120]
MKPEELFITMIEPRIKLFILNFLAYQPAQSMPAIQLHFWRNKKEATQALWELCNARLVSKTITSTTCFYQLTDMGQDYLKIVGQLLIWSKEHQFYGGY